MYETLQAHEAILAREKAVTIQTPTSFHTPGFFQFRGEQALSLLRLLQRPYQGS